LDMPLKSSAPKAARLTWFDSLRGISILWIAIFHFFMAYDAGRHPWILGLFSFPAFLEGCAPSPASFLGTVGCVLDGLLAAIFERGSQAVAVFVVASGFGLTYSLVKKGMPPGGWGRWYRRRVLRLFPLYWLGHLICLISPFVLLKDPIDYRFALSFLGNRIYPPEAMFYYLVPAWWYFGLLIQLYLVFPLLYGLLKKLGPAPFLMWSILATIGARFLLVDVFHANSDYAQGAFFMGRLWEFATGMVFAYYYSEHPGLVEERLFAWQTLAAGIVIYVLGVYSYQPVFFHVFTDGFIGTGLTIILAHCARWVDRLLIMRSALVHVGAYSYGLYLLHQPYVLYFGERLRGEPMLHFVLYAFVILGIIAILSMLLEWYVNHLTNSLFYRPDRQDLKG
jgi:peptidoglycan/LPS O-acetylase OafA/YrhL